MGKTSDGILDELRAIKKLLKGAHKTCVAFRASRLSPFEQNEHARLIRNDVDVALMRVERVVVLCRKLKKEEG